MERRRRVGRLLAAAALSALLTSLVITLPALGQSGGGSPPPPSEEVFRQVGDVELHVRVHPPAPGSAPAPSVVLVHGGGWSSGDSSDMDDWAELLARAGWVAFSIDYRIAEDASPSWPDALDDVRAGIGWVHDNASRFGGDPERIGLFGESAGAHLAMLVAVDGTGGPELSAVALWSPPLRLDTLVPEAPGGPVPGCTGNEPCQEFWAMGWVERFVGCAPSECAETYAEASPLARATRLGVPLWMANGTEELVPFQPVQQLADRLSTSGVDHEILAVEGPAHGHGYATVVWNPMVAWLAEQFGVPTPDPVEFPGDEDDTATVVAVALAALVGVGALAVLLVRRTSDRS